MSWLIVKLYAFCPIPQSRGYTLARQLACCQPNRDSERARFRKRFDRMLTLPLGKIEPGLRWALAVVASASKNPRLDWVRLTDDLSMWERERIRLRWAEQFLENDKRR